MDGLDLGFNLGYNKSKLLDDVYSVVSGAQLAASGDPLPFAPKFTYNLYAAYTFKVSDSLSLFARGDYAYVDEFNTDFGLAGVASTLPSYDILDLRAGLAGDRWSVTAFVENVTDERAILNVSDRCITDSSVIGRARTA